MLQWKKSNRKYSIQAYYQRNWDGRYLKSYMWRCNTCDIVGENSFDAAYGDVLKIKTGRLHPFQRCFKGILAHAKKYHPARYERWKGNQ